MDAIKKIFGKNITLGRKILQVQNALAYFAKENTKIFQHFVKKANAALGKGNLY